MQKIALFVFVMMMMGTIQAQNVVNLAPKEFETALKADKNAKLIDVRTDWEFKKGHLNNAVNYDWNADDFETQVKAISKETPLYVYCFSGGRSAEAATKLKSLGYKKVVNMTGGFDAWSKAKLPTIK